MNGAWKWAQSKASQDQASSRRRRVLVPLSHDATPLRDACSVHAGLLYFEIDIANQIAGPVYYFEPHLAADSTSMVVPLPSGITTLLDSLGVMQVHRVHIGQEQSPNCTLWILGVLKLLLFGGGMVEAARLGKINLGTPTGDRVSHMDGAQAYPEPCDASYVFTRSAALPHCGTLRIW